MAVEIRYTTPYVSGLNWVLNGPISEQVPVQDQSGQNGTVIVKREPGLTIEVTPYLGTIPCQVESYEFKKSPEDGDLDVADVLTAAGVDVAAAWAEALDSMSNIFPILKDPEAGDEKYGKKVYLRLDAWRANLQWVGPKLVAAIVGVYDSAQYTKPIAYVQLAFADGDSLRQRETQKNEMLRQIAYAETILDGTVEGWADKTQEQKDQLTAQANQTIAAYNKQIALMDAQLVAPLADLLAMPTIQQSIGALLVGAFSTLKENHADWADVDVASVMSRFALPSVS